MGEGREEGEYELLNKPLSQRDRRQVFTEHTQLHTKQLVRCLSPWMLLVLATCKAYLKNQSAEEEEENSNNSNNITKYNNNKKKKNNDDIKMYNSRLFLQSPHCATKCVQQIYSSGQGTIVCKSLATHPVLITYNMSCATWYKRTAQRSY